MKLFQMACVSLCTQHMYVFFEYLSCKKQSYHLQLHAEYNRDNDLYLPHRIAQAFELGQFVRHTGKAADFIVLAGDFNIEPEDLGYSIILNIGNLYDAYENRPNREYDDGMTCDRPDNIYTHKSLLKSMPQGKRLDYIMYQSGRGRLLSFCFLKIRSYQ